jgi:hypothetical protein
VSNGASEIGSHSSGGLLSFGIESVNSHNGQTVLIHIKDGKAPVRRRPLTATSAIGTDWPGPVLCGRGADMQQRKFITLMGSAMPMPFAVRALQPSWFFWRI